jgi:phage gp36-like protein
VAYATTNDLAALGVSAEVTGSLAPAGITLALNATSKKIDSYLRQRYTLPIIGGDLEALARCNAILAAYDILVAQAGYNPDDPANLNWEKRAADELAWLRDIAASRVDPGLIDSASPGSPAGDDAGAEAYSGTPRGW